MTQKQAWRNSMDKSKLEGHIAHLIQHHADLEKQIKEGRSNYVGDAKLAKVKQERLIVKRQIEETKDKLKAL